jgi:hypothetical protein
MENLLITQKDSWLPVLTKRRLERLELQGVDRVWFVFDDSKSIPLVRDALEGRGYRLERLRAGPTMLLFGRSAVRHASVGR